MKIVKLQMEELTCPSCVKKIESVLVKQEGVSEVKVLFSSSKVKVGYDENMITVDQIQTTLHKLGYRVLKSNAS